MNYQIWEPYYPGSGYATIEGFEGLSDQQVVDVFFGKKISGIDPRGVDARISDGRIADVLSTVTGSFALSEKLRKVMTAFDEINYQWIPLKTGKRSKRQYYLCNILGRISCFDEDRSIYQRYPAAPHAIHDLRRLVLRPIPVTAPSVFHVAEIPALILIRDGLRLKLQTISSTLGAFTKVNQYIRP